jgi:RNA polymerase sigma-54 factor
VGARDVAECLAIQLKDKNRFDPAMAALVDNLPLLARRDMPALRAVCGVDDEDLREMVAELRALTPRPGAAFGGEPAQTVVPDVFVREGLGGLWLVELNSETLPRLLVDQRYHARVSAAARTDQEKTFVSDCAAQASWLVKSLDQRAKTILKVSSEIVRQQDAFLIYGVEHLRPLNLKTVAEAIGMHESTVSRVTSNKYLATPRGVFEMKFFFTSAIQATEGGEAHSAESVRHKIRQLIDAEATGRDVLLEIDWQGAAQVRSLFPHAVGIFILPPSITELERRLRARGEDTEAVITRRLAAAQSEIRHASEFEYAIINNDFSEALADISAVVRAVRVASRYQQAQHPELF